MSSRLSIPQGPGRIAVAAAAAAWAGAEAGLNWGLAAVAAGLLAAGAAAVRGFRPPVVLVVTAFAAATLSGALAQGRIDATLAAAVPEGRQTVAGRAHTDPQPSRRGHQFLLSPSHLRVGPEWVRWDGPRLSIVSSDAGGLVAGGRVVVSGDLRSDPHVRRGDPVAGTMEATSLEALGPAADPLFRIGNLLRRRVEDGLAAHRPDPAAALLSGFLIGDVRDLPAADEEALRRAGLTHFVAVSGSNVALFLAAWWLAAGPLAADPRARAGLGLAGLAVFVVVTRWEPSVVRAATMAALVLGGRLASVPVDAWTALGAAVALLTIIAADLIRNAGFQLSVAATAGVVAGARVFAGRRPRWAWTALSATASAQLAVAPLLLLHFGTVPLLAPVSNLIAAPLVMAATAAGGIGVVSGLGPLTAAAMTFARVVLVVARAAAGWPQLGATGVAVAAAVLALAAVERLRAAVVLAAAGVVAVVVAWPVAPPSAPTVIFLDVGQGDSALLVGPSGETILVDGGPEARTLVAALRRHHVRRIDLMVVSHRHADHVAGLLGIVGSVDIGRLWHPGPVEPGLLADLVDAAAAAGAVVETPGLGWSARVGAFTVEVLGPVRRYASPNDGSLVLWVEAGGRSLLLPGDIEAIAQADLGPLRADVLKVPHQGSATSDLAWLTASAGDLAIISVGPNTFGHPSDEVIATLRRAGAEVLRTDEEGDVEVPLR